MQVKCKCHGNKIERETAYKVVVGKVNHYYCSKDVYENIVMQKQYREKVYEKINEIFGERVINTALFSEMNQIAKQSSYQLMLGYLDDNKQNIEVSLKKNFNCEYAKIRYFSAIVKNNIADYKGNLKDKNEVLKQTEFEFLPVKYCKQQRKKPFAQIEGSVGQ